MKTERNFPKAIITKKGENWVGGQKAQRRIVRIVCIRIVSIKHKQFIRRRRVEAFLPILQRVKKQTRIFLPTLQKRSTIDVFSGATTMWSIIK